MRSKLFLFFTVFFHFTHAFDLTKINMAWVYDLNAPLYIKTKSVDLENQYRVFIEITNRSRTSWKLKYVLQKRYNANKHILINPSVDTIYRKRNQVLLQVDFPKKEEPLLVVEFNAGKFQLYKDVSLRQGLHLYPKNKSSLPLMTNYCIDSTLTVNTSDSVFLTAYQDSLEFVKPPYVRLKQLLPSIPADTGFYYKNEIQLPEDKLYQLTSHENDDVGTSILKVNKFFPKETELGNLVAALSYITSDAEFSSIVTAKNPKVAFDRFWLKAFTNKQAARKALRNYYYSVEAANLLFTDFKKGWNTDRGMIFIVFGAPPVVIRSNNEEIWKYNESLSFEFAVISTFFAPRTYVLRRNPKYSQVWKKQRMLFRLDYE